MKNKKSKTKNKKLKMKKGDTVIVLAGRDKGKKGKILEALPKEARVIVERVNVVKKHQRPTREFRGGIIEKPLALSACKVMVVCSKCGDPARIRQKEVEGKNARACARCGEVIDKL